MHLLPLPAQALAELAQLLLLLPQRLNHRSGQLRQGGLQPLQVRVAWQLFQLRPHGFEGIAAAGWRLPQGRGHGGDGAVVAVGGGEFDHG